MPYKRHWVSVLLAAVLTSAIVLQPSPACADPDDPCAPWPLEGNPIEVTPSQVGQLRTMVAGASPGDTFLLHDGTYNLNGEYIWIDTADVTIRSYSGNREAVVLDGNYTTTDIVTVAASGVTIADITIKRSIWHPIHVVSTAGGDTLDTVIYNVHIVDPREQAVKINPVASGTYVDDGLVACSHIELTTAGRPHVNPEHGGCYTGGVDAHAAQGWVIRDNVIEGFWCPTGLSEHAIHMWQGSRDTLVERNVLHNNARGVGFGMLENDGGRTYPDNPCPSAEGGYVDHYGGIVRNNFVFANDTSLFASSGGFDCGICLWQVCGAEVVHNTVATTGTPRSSSVEWRFDHTVVTMTNNLVTHSLVDRGGTGAGNGNLEGAPLTLFVDGTGGDLHLDASAADAIDAGVNVAPGLCDADIDGDSRPLGAARDIGADEWQSPAPAAVADLRVTRAITAGGTLTATLSWTPPTHAVTTALRYAAALITDANWGAATPLVEAALGGTGVFTATMPYVGGTRYFALRTQNVLGNWSALSNNAFWPSTSVYLPLILRSQ